MSVDQVYEQHVRAMEPSDQLKLVERIVHDLATNGTPPRQRRAGRKWSEIRGIVPYPMCGEDAQQWVTRTRREDDEHREKALRGES